MTVYIEYVLLDNLIIDYLLLKYTFILTRTKSNLWWLLFCAFLGSVFALLCPLLKLPTILTILIKVVFSALLVFVASKYTSIKKYIIAFTVFNTYTFLLGGGVIGIFNLFHIPCNKEYSVGIIVLVAYLLIRFVSWVIKFIYKKRSIVSFLVNCEIRLDGKSVKTVGFFDSGNNLYYDKTNAPIVICSKSVAYNLINGKTKGNYIKASTIAGEKKILVFKVDELIINENNNKKCYKEAMLGVSDNSFDEGYQLILHSEYIGGKIC